MKSKHQQTPAALRANQTPVAPAVYRPQPLPHVLQTKTSRVRSQPRVFETHRTAIQPKTLSRNVVQPPSLKTQAIVNSVPPRTIQLMSFARFWKWSFLSNWGSYNADEQELLRVERQVRDLIAALHPRTKLRPNARRLIQEFQRIAAATIAERNYRTTRSRLLEINNELIEEDETQRHESALEDKRQAFKDRGRPAVPDIPDIYPESIDPEVWDSLVGEMPRHSKKKWRAGKNLPQMVEYLFKNFVAQNFGYSIMKGGARGLIGAGVESPEGNCIAYARAFADLLFSFGIDAEAKMVREEAEGRFIVRVPHFMDPKVIGHIYERGVLKAGYYMFSSHAATWVKELGRYYDPMARSSYTSLKPFIECELDSDKNEQVFYPRTPAKTLNPGYKWKLVKRGKEVSGGFNRLDLRPWEGE